MKARHEFNSDKEYVDYLRTYFAAMAMQGLCMNHKWAENMVQDDWDDFVERVTSGSKDLADALISELNKTEQK